MQHPLQSQKFNRTESAKTEARKFFLSIPIMSLRGLPFALSFCCSSSAVYIKRVLDFIIGSCTLQCRCKFSFRIFSKAAFSIRNVIIVMCVISNLLCSILLTVSTRSVIAANLNVIFPLYHFTNYARQNRGLRK